MPQVHLTTDSDDQRCLVVVFLRGAADGLNMVMPVEDDEYYRARPTIGIAKRDALKLDGFFGLNPRLASLKRFFDAGDLAILHAVGSEDETRSHFEAQDLMEHGGSGGGGWLARHLRYREGGTQASLSAVAISDALPECLRGAPSATALRSLDTFSLGEEGGTYAAALGTLYGRETGMLGTAARETLAALDRIDAIRKRPYVAAGGVAYGDDDFARGLRQIAQLIKGRIGLAAASIDLDGWDSHFAQSTLMDPLMDRLARGLAAFHADLGAAMKNTTVVVMTEFGRRLAENSALGTDHGRASIMLAMGGGVRGGKVIASWPGLQRGLLEGPGDLHVSTNFRNVLAPILARHGSAGVLDRVFPGFAMRPVELF